MQMGMAAAGVASTRFGISPLFELAALLRRLCHGSRGFLAETRWQQWRQALVGLDQDHDVRLVLGLLTGRQGSIVWVPGIPSTTTTIADDLAALDRIADEDLLADLQRYLPIQGSEVDTAAIRRRIVAGLRTLWDRLLADAWPAIRSVAEHEMSRTIGILRSSGWNRVFDSVCDGLIWDGHSLLLEGMESIDLNGAGGSGVVLVPSVFLAAGPVVRCGTQDPSVLFYPARGVGNLYAAAEVPSTALEALVGANRARVMIILDTPTNVSRLRDLLDLSLGSLSRHLAILIDSGLARSHRVGRSVEYELSDLGRAVISGQPESGRTAAGGRRGRTQLPADS